MIDAPNAVSAVSEIIANATQPTAPVVAAATVPTQEPVIEKPVEVEKPKEDDKFASRFAALTKREKLLQTKELEVKRLSEEVKNYQSTREQAKRNPIKYLESLGLSYNDITEFVLNNQEIPKDKRLELEIEEIKGKLSAKERMDEEAKLEETKQNYNKIVSGFVDNINKHITANAEKYEFTMQQDSYQDIVYSVIEKYWDANQKILSVEEACDLVEKHYETQYDKIRTLKKFQKVADVKEVTKPTEVKQSGFTLNNDSASQVPAPKEEPFNYQKSLEKATQMLKWV